MSGSTIQFHKIWIEQCEATQDIREHFGLQNALDYLVGEKLFHFIQAAETHPEFAGELPAFLVEIKQLFTPAEIHEYLDHLEKTKYLAPHEPEPDLDDLDADEDTWPANPVIGAEELLRFARVRQLLRERESNFLQK